MEFQVVGFGFRFGFRIIFGFRVLNPKFKRMGLGAKQRHEVPVLFYTVLVSPDR